MENVIIDALFNELIKTERAIMDLKEKSKQPSKHSQSYRDILVLKEYKKFIIELYEKLKAI